jgi:hypothetical protein
VNDTTLQGASDISKNSGNFMRGEVSVFVSVLPYGEEFSLNSSCLAYNADAGPGLRNRSQNSISSRQRDCKPI